MYLDYLKKFTILSTVNLVAQILLLIASPLLTRLYTPEEFGYFASLIAILMILSPLITARFDFAIINVKQQQNVKFTFFLSILSTIVITVIALISIIIYISFTNLEVYWIIYLPILIFLTGILNTLIQYNIRGRLFKKLAYSGLIKVIAMLSVQIILGLLGIGYIGLILGNILALLSFNYLLYDTRINSFFMNIHRLKLLSIFKKYKDLFAYSTTGNFITSLSININILFIGTYFSYTYVGLYFLVQKILEVPMSFFGNITAQLFYKYTSDSAHDFQTTLKLFLYTLTKLLLIGVIIFSIIYFYINDIFSLLFGNEWSDGGEMATLLIPVFFFRFLAIPLSSIVIIKNKHKEFFIFQLLHIIISVFIFYIEIILHLTFIEYLSVYSVIFTVYYLLMLKLLYSYLKYGSE